MLLTTPLTVFSLDFSFASYDGQARSAGNRLAGRSRFYKEVGTKLLGVAPWEETRTTSSTSSVSSSDTNKGSASDTVESPISAGVDGSQSATGVHHVPQQKSKKSLLSLEAMLTPRFPGDDPPAPIIDGEESNSNSNSNSSTGWYGVTLDGRKVSTPMGQTLAVPSETLAYMIAAEWDSQTKQLQPSNMPLMTLACTALDQAAHQPQFYRDTALMYLPTDTTCFWADPTEDRLLHRRQQQSWKALHEFCTERLGGGKASPITAYGMDGMLMSRKRGDEKPNAGLPHPEGLMEAATRWTHSLDAWQLVALNSIATQAKSFLIAFAMLESTGLSLSLEKNPTAAPFGDVVEAAEASRVEEEFQISIWGMVEGQHDYDRLNCSIQLHSANLFAKTILMEKN
eukprot:jgi/Psemu1/282724/fgenesh1_pg.12_\